MRSASPGAVDTRSRDVTFPGDGATLTGHLALPPAGGPHPAVVVIHEILGLNEQIRDVADRFAGEGYAALAVDLFADRNRALCMARFMSGLLLNALDHDEEELRRSIQRRLRKTENKSKHDW